MNWLYENRVAVLMIVGLLAWIAVLFVLNELGWWSFSGWLEGRGW